MSSDPLGIYDISDDEGKGRKAERSLENAEQETSWTDEAREDREEVLQGGPKEEEKEEEDDDDEESEEGEVEEEDDTQPRICTVCFNLKLFVEPINIHPTIEQTGTSRNVLYEEVLRDRIKSTILVKLEFYELLESTRLGYCVYCQFVFDCLRTEDAEPDESKSTIIRVIARAGHPFYLYWDDKNRGLRRVEVYAEKGTIQQKKSSSQLTLFNIGTTPCIPELGHATEVSPRAFADPAFAQIREWLLECENGHPGCPRQSRTPPRRLVDVGIPTPPSGARKIRLIQDHRDPVKYIALSHCWGTEQNFTTKKATLEKRMDEIAWNELPKTYRDAVKVARKLHIRYIWIDSLCIVQDDE